MERPRLFGIVDLGVATVVAVAIFLPAREMYASSAIKANAAEEFSLALAEARTIARPGDGVAVEDFARKLGDAGMKDWAIEAAVRSSDRAKDSPTRWRALIAASAAYVDRVDVIPALDYANRALSACESSREKGDASACPSWEEVRMRIYQQHLDAGVKAGIDPRSDPAGFRRAGEAGLRQIRINGKPDVPGPAPAAGSGSSTTTPTP